MKKIKPLILMTTFLIFLLLPIAALGQDSSTSGRLELWGDISERVLIIDRGDYTKKELILLGEKYQGTPLLEILAKSKITIPQAILVVGRDGRTVEIDEKYLGRGYLAWTTKYGVRFLCEDLPAPTSIQDVIKIVLINSQNSTVRIIIENAGQRTVYSMSKLLSGELRQFYLLEGKVGKYSSKEQSAQADVLVCHLGIPVKELIKYSGRDLDKVVAFDKAGEKKQFSSNAFLSLNWNRFTLLEPQIGGEKMLDVERILIE